MVTRDFSGKEIVNTGNYSLARFNGDHAILKWNPPEDHDTEPRTVVVPQHDHVAIGTLHDIAAQAGANDFDAFCEWIARNR